MDQLTSLKTEVNKLKNEVVAMDKGLFDKSGKRPSPGKSIHHDFSSATVNKLNRSCQNKKSVTKNRFFFYFAKTSLSVN